MATRALVVDDDFRSCEMLQIILETAGMTADIQTDSQQAESLLLGEKFDLVFLDMHMPEPSGLQLAARMRAGGMNQKSIIVMITGDTTPRAMQNCFAAGANFFVFKPIDTARLLRLIRASESSVHQEKRRFQRVPWQCRAVLHKGGEQRNGTTIDISLGGVMVALDNPYFVDTRVEVEVHCIPKAPPILATGRVARQDLAEGAIGIEFQNVRAEDMTRLRDFLLPQILLANEPAKPAGHAAAGNRGRVPAARA
jgi:DNA-binding response OmpR family regulator